jgi:serine protease AprX
VAKVTINGITVDPSTQESALAAANLVTPDASDSNYILIQTTQPLDRAQKSELEGKGVLILEYVPDSTYLCQFNPTNLDEIRALPYVAWANVYMQGFKIAPALADLPSGGPRVHSLMEMASATERIPNNTPKTVDIVFHRDVDPDAVREQVAVEWAEGATYGAVQVPSRLGEHRRGAAH